MALSTQDFMLAKRRAFNYLRNFTKPKSMLIGQAFFSYLAQFTTKPDIQISEFDVLTNTDVVLANAACKLYAFFLYKPTATACFFKATDNATTCSTDGTQDISIKTAALAKSEIELLFPDGRAMANGVTCQANTTGTGSTGSGANGVKGFAIIGGP